MTRDLPPIPEANRSDPPIYVLRTVQGHTVYGIYQQRGEAEEAQARAFKPDGLEIVVYGPPFTL